ncbi:MAG: DUF362 domain-containing protein [Acidobacteria bacterium]|nr:DUF362 domain-containing protein [Acidobacteriota bacterium]MBI3281274.1 DUF362 domain-containing protein [Acidobacteriota bacterium]
MDCTRRRLFASVAGALSASQLALQAQTSSKAERTKWSMPGLHPGRVVAVNHPGSIVSGQYQQAAVSEMIRRGMMELTGAPDLTAAWKQFFEPGDVVGIKVNPVGQPHVISDATVMREIIAGLRSAGLKPQDIVVYDRYRNQFLRAGFDKWLPPGVRTYSATGDYDNIQQAIEGYDPDHYLDMALTLPGQDAGSLTARRSYAARFITKEINKLINLAVLKDHQSAGVTLALKNLSHGLVNNVNRSHSTKTLNACGSFIPAVVALPVIRNKAVLHIMDGVKALYHGGPGARPQFVWEHKAIYLATDPVALDRTGWGVIDEKRVSLGMKRLVEDTPDKFSTYVHRQPEHIEIAGALGLGQWDKIDLRKISLG